MNPSEKDPSPDFDLPEENLPPKSEEVRLPAAEYEELQNRLKELENLKERLMHAAADFDNAKKRLTREREEFVRFSQENLIRQLLPVLDNFERALAHAGESKTSGKANEALKGIVAGVQMVFKQLTDVLKKEGLTRLQCVGEKFDPHQHEVVSYLEEEGPEEVVAEEVEAGYRLHDRLLRAAKVRVRVSPSRHKEEEMT